MEQDKTSTLFLSITNPEAANREKEWLKECQQLYLEIAMKLEQGSIKPVNTTTNNGDRSFPADVFQNLILTGANLGVFTGFYNLVKLWLENRKTCEVTITYPDGFTLKVSKISLDMAMEMHKKHIQETTSKGHILPKSTAHKFKK